MQPHVPFGNTFLPNASTQQNGQRMQRTQRLALANEGHKSIVDPALKLIAQNADKDVIVRHGGVMMLAKRQRPGVPAAPADSSGGAA